MAKNTISQEQIIEINELYLQIKTYSGVSRALGGTPAPTTVKKYIIPGYVSKKNINKKYFYKSDLPTFSVDSFTNIKNWGDLCVLSEEEEKGISELWNEILI